MQESKIMIIDSILENKAEQKQNICSDNIQKILDFLVNESETPKYINDEYNIENVRKLWNYIACCTIYEKERDLRNYWQNMIKSWCFSIISYCPCIIHYNHFMARMIDTCEIENITFTLYRHMVFAGLYFLEQYIDTIKPPYSEVFKVTNWVLNAFELYKVTDHYIYSPCSSHAACAAVKICFNMPIDPEFKDNSNEKVYELQ